MSKILRIGISFMILGVIVLCSNSCGLFTSENPDEYEYDPESFETEPNVAVINNEDIIVTEPITVTQEPEPEIEPPVTPLGNVFSASGTIKSDTNKLLKLHIEWKASQTADNEYVDLDITVYLNCYAITVGARTNSTLTVNGEKVEFSTPMIINENNSMTSIELYKKNMQIHNPAREEINSIDIEATYYFGGSYGGEAIGWIEVSGTAILFDDGSPISENKINETSETVKNPLAPELPNDPFKPVEE